LFLLMFCLGGGGMAGYLWLTKPEPEAAPTETEKPPRFTWVTKGSGTKEKDERTPRDKDKPKDKPPIKD